MQVAGLDDYLLVPAGAVLVIVIAILLIKKTGGMRRKPSNGEFEREEVHIEDEDEDDEPVRVETDEVQKYKAKVDQLSRRSMRKATKMSS
jgi:hypothetical protein